MRIIAINNNPGTNQKVDFGQGAKDVEIIVKVLPEGKRDKAFKLITAGINDLKKIGGDEPKIRFTDTRDFAVELEVPGRTPYKKELKHCKEYYAKKGLFNRSRMKALVKDALRATRKAYNMAQRDYREWAKGWGKNY